MTFGTFKDLAIEFLGNINYPKPYGYYLTCHIFPTEVEIPQSKYRLSFPVVLYLLQA